MLGLTNSDIVLTGSRWWDITDTFFPRGLSLKAFRDVHFLCYKQWLLHWWLWCCLFMKYQLAFLDSFGFYSTRQTHSPFFLLVIYIYIFWLQYMQSNISFSLKHFLRVLEKHCSFFFLLEIKCKSCSLRGKMQRVKSWHNLINEANYFHSKQRNVKNKLLEARKGYSGTHIARNVISLNLFLCKSIASSKPVFIFF